MKTTLVVALALASLVVTGCGDDGKSPKIKSFVASSQSLPEGGEDVTFTWEVSRAKSISLLPFPGLVTGSSATVNVTEPTTFTLLAKNSDGSDRKKLSIAIGEPFTVTGTLVTYLGAPASNQQVFVDEEIFVTDANGQFTAENVIPPYDLGVVSTNPGGPNFGGSALLVTVYHGVTRADPRVLCSFCDLVFGSSATVSGTVTGGVGFPYPTPTPDPDFWTSVVVSGPEFGSQGTDADPGTGDFSISVDWPSTTTIPVSVATLQGQLIPSVLFTGFHRETDSVSDGAITDVDPVLSPVSTLHITGALDAPFPVTNSYVSGWADLGNPAVAPGGALLGFPLAYAERISLPTAVVATNESYSFAVPGIAGASYGVFASADGPDGVGSRVFTAIPANVSVVDLEMPEISHLLTPVQNAQVDTGTVFSGSPVDGGTYQFMFNSSVPFGGGGPDISLYVFSNTSTLTFPDLGMLGSPADGRVFSWGVSSLVGFGSVDGLVEDAMIAPEDTFGSSFSFEQRSFTYSPSTAFSGRLPH